MYVRAAKNGLMGDNALKRELILHQIMIFCSIFLHGTPSAFTCVNKGVLLHVRLLVKSLCAILAREWPRVGVNQQVRGQRRRAAKHLVALEAAVDPATTGSAHLPLP